MNLLHEFVARRDHHNFAISGLAMTRSSKAQIQEVRKKSLESKNG